MKTVKILQDFTAYPNGTRTDYVAGDELEVSNEFFEQQKDKGLFREVTASKAAAKAKGD